MTDLTEIKKLLKTDKLVVGTDETLKMLRTKGLEKVYLASNCPASVREDITRYADIAGVTLIQLEMPNDELGDVCKKPFSISVLGVAK